ncbi:DUF2513 domain-containing protein [Burkholderia glumae]|uniref:DUF2513 domain-containing protein n=1 Tax=Burkholderia glumae TaxID=337 RepID=UPI0005C2A166|nr:DUF2513 domain-containing protein [Burkholderia glumae]MCM2494579.1 DUF2513 domain-containing protein [Burkholderia glumae]MCM2545449.1 DUF2513 domain-containing protein [Burkholderia glumae]
MERDWQRIRVVLQAMIRTEASDRDLAQDELLMYDRDKTRFHFQLLEEAGLIAGHPPGEPFLTARVTWQGYELLEILSAELFWAKIKNVAAEKGIALTFSNIGTIAEHLARQLLK